MKVYPFLAIKGYSNSYIVANSSAREAIIIDPGVVSQSMIDTLEARSYVPVGTLITHNHKSHSEGIGTLKKIYDTKIFAADPTLASNANCLLHDNGILNLAGYDVEFMSLPGHSSDSMIFKIGKVIFTGDALNAGMLGKTTNFYADLRLQTNVLTKIFSQSDDTVLMHGDGPPSTVGAEKNFNLSLGCPLITSVAANELNFTLL